MNMKNVCKANYRMSLLIPVLTILFTLLSVNVVAGNNYYFSTSTGDDSRTPTQAKNQATPWKTINKLNSYFSSLLPGDFALFKCGEVFYGTIQVNKSGTSALPIVIGAYGTGEKPIITGFKTITGWTNIGGNIWESSVTECKSSLNMVILDGNVQVVGRYPNSTLLTYESYSGSSSIKDNQLTNTPNWTGAEVVIRANPFNWVRYPVSSHSTTVINYSGSTYTDLNANFGYYFQRDPKTLDLNGEWYLHPTTKKLRMYFSDNNPNAHVVKASTLDYVVYQNSYQNNRSYIRFENLTFEGGNESNIIINGTSTNNTILNCTSNYSGKNGITTSGLTNAVIKNCTVNNSLSTGILHSGNNAAITGNTVTKSGMLFGMLPQYGGGSGIEIVTGTGNIIQYNHVNSTGKHGIFLRGNSSIVKNNLVEYAALTHDDVGGIYTTGSYINSKIIGNIVLYTTGDKTGCTNANISVEGIYLDAPHTGVYVEGNTVAHSGRGGIRYHNAWNVTARFNTLYDNPVNIMIVKSALGSSYSYNQNIKNNISVCKTSSQLAFWIYNYFDGEPLTFGTSDSNYFARPILDTNPIRTSKPGNDTYYTLEQWKSASGKDIHSYKSPQAITNVNEILFEYNATQSNKTISFSGNYKGINGTIYSNSTILLPYTSIVLLKVPGTTNQPPSIQNQGFQLNENSPNGTTVGTVIASDPNTGQILTYSILSGNTNGAFTIAATTGILKVANTTALNFEVNQTITLVVKVQDNGTGNLVSQANVTVTLINLNEPPSIVNQSFSVIENSSIGSQVGTVVASDPDAGQTKTFSILSGNTNNAFAINSSTGILTVANSSALNIASTPIFSLILKVQDNGTGNLSGQANASINILSAGNCSATGNISYQIWNNIGSGVSVANLTGSINYPDNPSSTALITSMEAIINQYDNFGARIAGYICAPATGSYTFWIASDDNGELWLSTNSLPANKQKIAYHTGFTSSRQWNKYATQKSAIINLIQGQSYYIEALMKDATGGDNFAIGWLKPGQTGTEPSGIIPGSVLSPIGSSQAVLVNSVSLPSTSAVNTGANTTLAANVLPSNAANTILAWTSSNTLVATVNSSGLVTGKAAGTSTIQATSTDGSNKTGTCVVTTNPPACSSVGNISYQVWNNIGSGISVANLTGNINYPDNPSSTTLITSMEALNSQFDNFGARISGYICAPATGSYTFWIASDDNGELWLSTNSLPANKQKIAYHNGFTASRQWNKYATQKSAIISLIQGQSYYIEALMKDATGGDNFAIGWLKPGQTGTEPSGIIPGTVLSPIATAQLLVTNVNVQASGSVSIGAAFTPTATVLPGNATNSILSWTSSNSLIASVNNMGQVVGLTPGTASIKATSADGSNKSGTCLVTVNNPSCSAVGNISYQVWNNIGSGLSVANLISNINYPNNPTSNIFIPSMEAAGNQFDNFGARIAGYICAPATGSYTFWIASDDYSELWLSTTDQPVNKQKIAFHNGFTFSREWNKYATQKSVVINLVQGKSYYIEALMKDGSGGDNFAVGWIKPGQTGSVPSEIIPGSVLSPDGSKSIEALTENINVPEQEIGLLVYPNPISGGELTIKVENAPPLVELNIYTISGVKCYSAQIKNSEIIKIDKTIFKSGIYIVKIFNEQFVKTTKLIVN